MTEMYQIHPDYEVYFRTYGNTIQSRLTQLSPKEFNQSDPFIMLEPGRTLLIGDIDDELKRLLDRFGKPTLNQLTATSGRTGGVFSTRAYDSLRVYLFGDAAATEAPRARPATRTKKKAVYRDLAQPEFEPAH